MACLVYVVDGLNRIIAVNGEVRQLEDCILGDPLASTISDRPAGSLYADILARIRAGQPADLTPSGDGSPAQQRIDRKVPQHEASRKVPW
jgi:hypothetical protein